MTRRAFAKVGSARFVFDDEKAAAERKAKGRSMTTQPATQMDPKLFDEGVPVLMLAGLASTAIEAQVVRWREELKLPLDWHYVGGRALVCCFPADRDRVRQYLDGFAPMVMPL